MAIGLIALLDDIAVVLDDVAVMSKLAVKKTAGVIGDDLALNANQVSGLESTRELPVVWAVAKGSLVNKVILVPIALLLSAFASWAITPLLIAGGLFLCFEGAEKVASKFFSHGAKSDKAAVTRAALLDPNVDLVALEKSKIKGAIRTDFILSAEIIVIALGAFTTSSILIQSLSLSIIALGMSVFVYGLVAVIVKLDDMGLSLMNKPGRAEIAKLLGRGLVTGTPWLMKALSFFGTVAMFAVGGGILTHSWPEFEILMDRSGMSEYWIRIPMEIAIGAVAGLICMLVVEVFSTLRANKFEDA